MPQALAATVVLAFTSLAIGYYFGSQFAAPPPPPVPLDDPRADDDDELDEESNSDGDLAAIKGSGQCKMVLLVRTDLKMTSGKIAAQHATLAAYKALFRTNPRLLKHWERTGQAKIALKVSSEEQLLELEAIAKSLNLCARSIHDAGHTQVEAGTTTVCAIGPAPIALVNEVTGSLRLL